MNPHDIVLTGVPRSGTTLTCHLLNKLADTIALFEPIATRDLAEAGNSAAACAEVRRFFQEARTAAVEEGRIYSKHVQGEVPTNHVVRREGKALRKGAFELSWIDVGKPLTKDFTLVIKHPSAFAALLDGLTVDFPSYAIVRNPIGVLGSWNSVEMAVRRGHAPAAERFAPELHAELKRIPDALDRQLHLLSWFFQRFRDCLPPERVLKYEDIVATQGKAIAVIQPAARNLEEPLQSRNRNPDYDQTNFEALAERLLASEGAYWHFYSREDVRRVLAT